MRRHACIAALIVLGTSPVARAQDEGQIRTASQCASLTSAEEEIACLRAALEMREARDRGETTLSVSQPSEVVHSSPNFGQEQVAPRHPDPSNNSTQTLLATVVATQRDHRGRLTVRLDNGQTWQQAEASAIPLRLQAGSSEIEITRSGFGGYRLRVPALGRRIAVRRVE